MIVKALPFSLQTFTSRHNLFSPGGPTAHRPACSSTSMHCSRMQLACGRASKQTALTGFCHCNGFYRQWWDVGRGGTPAFIYTLLISTTCHRFVSHHAWLRMWRSAEDHMSKGPPALINYGRQPSSNTPLTYQERRCFQAYATYVVALDAPWWKSSRFLLSHFLGKVLVNI